MDEETKKSTKTATELLEFRKHLNLDQSQFAEKIGVGQTAVSHYEIGRRVPVPSIAKKILKLALENGYELTWGDLYD